jgi:uncharacterized membrane protein
LFNDELTVTDGPPAALLQRIWACNAATLRKFRPTAPWARSVARAPRSLALLVAAAGLLGALAAATPARAEFSVCNQTLDVVNVAIGHQAGEVFRTEGWWTIGSNQCAEVIREPLANRYIYVFATDVFGQTLIDGTQPMCIAPKKFTIDNPDSCWQRGYREVKFVEVDTKSQDHWTMFLSEPPDAGN